MRAAPKTVDIDEMIATLPRNEQLVVKRLRALVAECLPQASENMYDDVVMPFYRRNRLICFILPPSAICEANNNKQNEKGIALGFNQGRLMSNHDGLLQSEGRKQVYMMYFKNPRDIDDNQLRALLYEAGMIDAQFAKKKRDIST